MTQIVAKKGERKLYLVSGKRALKEYDFGLGQAPVGHKQFEGDSKTPEGMYFINRKNPQSRFHLSVGISYPNSADSARAAMAGLRPGGDIMIHGLGPEGRVLVQQKRDWTAGCIAVNDQEIEELFAMVNTGTPIFIYA